MAYKLQLKRGVLASLPNGSVGEPLFTTDTFDLYVGKGDGTNVKIQKFIASGSSSQFLKGDGSLDSNTYIGLTALSASAPLSYNNTTGAFTISQAGGSTNGYLSSGDWTTFNAKQAALSGSGIVKSTGGTISYLTDNTANWDAAYNDKINSASVSGTTTKTLTLTQQDGGTITTSWSDYDTAPVTSVFGRTGDVVAANGDYTTSQVTEGTNLYYTDARARAAITLTTTGSSGASTYVGGTLNIPTYTLAGLGGVASSRQLTINGTTYDLSADRSWSVGTVTSVDMSVPTGFAISGNPITSSGTLALAFAAGYSLPTTSSQANWDAAYNDKINSASVTGTTTKTLTLTQQDGGTITASWTDINTDAVSSVFGRTGAVVAQSGDYTTTQVTEGTNLYYTEARVSANTDVAANTAARHNAVTLGTANGLSLSTQQLSLALASSSTTGALSSTDWTTFNNKENAITAGTTLQYYRGDKTFQTLNTSVVPESGNLYYTDARSRAALSFVAGSGAYNSTTGVITIPTNTNQLTNGASFITLASLSGGAGISYNNTTGVIASTITQYTDAMARASISGGTGISYNSTTGVITNTITQYTDAMARASLSFVAGSGAYNSTTGVITIPTNTNQLTNGAAFITLGSLSASAPLSYNNGTGAFTISQASSTTNGFLSSTDWSTFNNKIGGSGTTNYVPKFTASGTIGNSAIQEVSGNVGVGVTPSAWSLIGLSAIQVQNGGFYGYSVDEVGVTSNAYFNSGWKYINNSFATQYSTFNGSHRWFTAPSGTAGAAISFTQAMTLTANGRLLLGTTTEGTYLLDVNGTGRFSGRLDVTGTTNYSALKTTNTSGNIYWGVDNSTGTDFTGVAYARFIYSEGAYPLITYVNGAERMRIASTGAATFSSSVTAVSLTSLDILNSFSAKFGANSSTPSWVAIGTISGVPSINGYNNSFSSTTNLSLQPNGGNVGIGTTAPATLLDVRSANIIGATGATIRVGSQNHGGSGDEFANLEFYWGDPDYAEVKAKIYAKNTGNVGPGGGGAADLLFATRTPFGTLDERMRITSGGNVGIGTTSPSQKLDVSGNIQVTGAGNWFRYDTYGYFGSGSVSGGATTDVAVRSENNLLFSTGGATERMRITSGGRVLINQTNDNGTDALQITGGIYSTLGIKPTFNLGTISTNATITQNITRGGLYILSNGNNNSALIMITTSGGSRGVQLVFSTNGNNDIVVGTTSEPSGGNYLRLWMSAVDTLSIKNVNAGYGGPYYLSAINTY